MNRNIQTYVPAVPLPSSRAALLFKNLDSLLLGGAIICSNLPEADLNGP
jgi:hypothetical protein